MRVMTTLHAVVGAPCGQWHFSYGNRGADIKTKDGRHYFRLLLRVQCGIGKKSSTVRSMWVATMRQPGRYRADPDWRKYAKYPRHVRVLIWGYLSE